MGYRFCSSWLKLAAFALAVVLLGTAFLYGSIGVQCFSMRMYGDAELYHTTWECAEAVRDQGMAVIEQFRRNPEYPHWDRFLEDQNLRFIILEEDTGDVKATYLEGLDIDPPENLRDNLFLYQYDSHMSRGEPGSVLEHVYVCDYYFSDTWQGDASFSEYPVPMDETAPGPDEEAPETVYQILYLLGDQIVNNGDQISQGYRVYLYFQRMADRTFLDFGVSLIVAVVCSVFLLAQAGKKPGKQELQAGWTERIPADLLLAAAVAAGIGMIALFVLLMDIYNSAWIGLRELAMVQTACSVGAAACGGLILLIFSSFVIRLRLGQFWQSMLLFRAVGWCGRMLRRAFGWIFRRLWMGLRSIGLVPRAVLGCLVVLAVEVILIVWLTNVHEPFFPGLLLVLFNLAMLLLLIWGFAQLRLLQKAAAALADGDLESKLDTAHMYWAFREHGDHLNAIAGGMNKAVEQRMKSERLKTELITNVSHDIKTPLTSIVNYVDLLQKPHTEAEGVQYLEVLDRQAKRLKKLTENLVEASRASTGNMPVQLAPTSVLELINQAVEEYRERLEAGRLEIVTALRGDLTMLADGKLMWRILDNLLNNVVKYALAGTRVYVTAEKRAERVVIAVKNISRDPLNVSADELMERFVRGDSSRHTEGSGLGLNIARSLTILQGGTFDLTVDGDFFKAQITIPACDHP